MIPQRNTVAVIADAPIIQYSSGHSKARPLGSLTFVPFVGFYSEVGKDAAFDAACAALGVAQIEIRHPRTGAASEIIRHWNFSTGLQFYPLTLGPVAATVAASCANGNAKRTSEAGIGVRWGQAERSKLAVRGVLMSLISVGYTGLVQIAARSHMTDALLAALVDHTRIAERADDLVDRTRHPEKVGLWELLLTLDAGEEREVGRGETSTVRPIVSGHPDEITREYVRAIYLANADVRAVMAARWKETVAWAAEYQAGRTGDETPPAPQPEAPAPAEPAEPGALFTDDETPQQVEPSARIAAETGAAPRARRGRH